MQPKNIVVIGAGVIGVATAYMLAKDGHRVVLIDARSGPGEGTSLGNAAQLSWAYGDAMASPAMRHYLPGIALGRDPAFRVQWQADPSFWLWGLRFLLNTSASRYWANTSAALTLARESMRELETLQAEAELEFHYRAAGKLHLYPDAKGVEAARAAVEKKRKLGFVQELVDRDAATRIEPALDHYAGEIAGAIYTPGDAVGDANAFCRVLTDHIVRQYGVVTRFGRAVSGLSVSKGRVTAVQFFDQPSLPVDSVVAATGAASGRLGQLLPEARSVRPVRGYSLTIARPAAAPLVSLTDVRRKLAFAAIGDRFRVAGLADIVKIGRGYDDARLSALQEAADAVFPGMFSASPEVLRWSGERPMTPHSMPIIAPSRRLEGLYLNLGHGGLGWTLALGSARRVANLLDPMLMNK